AGHDDQLRPRALEVATHGQRPVAHLVERPVAVGTVRRVRHVEEFFGGQRAADLLGDAQPADARVEDADAPGHIHRRHYGKKPVEPMLAGMFESATMELQDGTSSTALSDLVWTKLPDLGAVASSAKPGHRAG